MAALHPLAARLPRYWRTVVVFVTMTVLQAAAAAFSIQLLSTVRAYVTGESLYSKGQMGAQIYLLDYAENHQEEDYQAFMDALRVPLGDRVAREALQQPVPDAARAREGFLEGGNQPSDIDGLIRLFVWFHELPFLADPIATWTEGDRVIAQMRALVDRARAHIRAGDWEAPDVLAMRAQAPALNRQLTQLESKFSFQLGEASRTTQNLLLIINVMIAATLTVSGVAFVRRSALVQAATQAEVVTRQESLQRLMDSTEEGLFGVDLLGQCTFVNRAALRMLGYDEEADLVGHDLQKVFGAGARSRVAASNFRLAYKSGQPTHSAEELLWRADGSSFPAELWCHPVVDDGDIQGAVATFFDITQRVELQAELRRGQLRLERLIDAVTDGVVTMDSDQEIVLFNRAAELMFGISAEAAIGSRMDRYMTKPPSPGEPSAGLSTDLRAEAPGSIHELIGRRTDGREFPLEASLSRLDTERGPLTTVVLRDVSALHAANAERRARQTLEAANQAKTEFLSRMSHELRTPLNAVIGFAQLLRMDAAQPLSPEQLDRVGHVETAGEHLLALVNDVLDLSRIESGEMALSSDDIAISDVVDEAVTMVSPLVTDAGVEVIVVPSSSGTTAAKRDLFSFSPVPQAEEIWVKADRVRMRQILVNLISNAVKYNRPNGSVSIDWRDVGEFCEIQVTDTGEGIAPDKLAGLFEPFNRLGAERSRVEGTGIGLVLSRQLAEMMGGTLDIASQFRQGTTATLRLRKGDAPADAGPSRPDRVAQLLTRHLDLLYAEDNEVNAELVRQLMRQRPSVSLRIAVSGAAALEMATLDPPDLMLVDMNLGDMTGLELAHALRQDRATRDIRLIALSADALPAQIDAAMRCGFQNYLTKPIKFQEVLAAIDFNMADL